MTLNDSAKISKTSSKLMLYNVEDLLDMGQMESGNFRKIIQKFNMKKCIQEMLDVQMYKANDKNINLTQTIEIHEDGVLSN
jgi:signal transduction histidine kinase